MVISLHRLETGGRLRAGTRVIHSSEVITLRPLLLVLALALHILVLDNSLTAYRAPTNCMTITRNDHLCYKSSRAPVQYYMY